MEYIDTKIEGVKLRRTDENDIFLILEFIKEIATYEKMLDEVIATEESIRDAIFVRKKAEVLIIEENSFPIGYVLYFYNFSTFVGREGLYLEDIYIRKEYRGKGIGKDIFRILSSIAFEKGCKRMEWVCLDWNENSIKFYKSLGAVEMSEWKIFRLKENEIKKLAQK